MDALLTIHAGTGGAESQDFASMLLRMYSKWAGPKADVLSVQPTDTGIRTATLRIKDGARMLGGESGVHRIQRNSPYGKGERHTSFATVEVLPDIPETTCPVNEKDVRMDFLRGTGKGGQNRNKVETGVRLVHGPTGITVTILSGRSQWQNRQNAWAVLRSRLAAKVEAPTKGTGPQWGLQIRTYTFNPNQMVKDHRTGVCVRSVRGVLDGDLRPFLTP